MSTDFLAYFSEVELLWTVIALAGIGFSSLNAWEALHDYIALGRLVNGKRRIALGHIRRETSRFLTQGLYIVVGLISGSTPPNPNPAGTSAVVAAILIVTSLFLTMNSILDRLDRRYLMNAYVGAPETQDQREDRTFGAERRALERKHRDDAP